jgi:hypothetical protein
LARRNSTAAYFIPKGAGAGRQISERLGWSFLIRQN